MSDEGKSVTLEMCNFQEMRLLRTLFLVKVYSNIGGVKGPRSRTCDGAEISGAITAGITVQLPASGGLTLVGLALLGGVVGVFL
jgi:hypothetical protein